MDNDTYAYEKINDEEYCERTFLIGWDVSALLERGKLLPLLYSWTTKKFGCSANFAVSPKSGTIAVISSDGELSIMQNKDDKLVLKSQVRVLLDPYPEFRLIEWNDTETLLFSTRSSAVMDVFEANGMFRYKIPMSDDTSGSLQIIAQIRSHSIVDDSNFSDDVFSLQIDGTFSAFKVGKEAYHRLFNVNLGTSPMCTMTYVPKYNILISCGEFQRLKQSQINETDSSSFGISVHRLINEFPYVDCLKQSFMKKAWHERIPFLSEKKSIVICAEVSPTQQHLLVVTSAGDVILFALPSLKILQSLMSLNEKLLPVQVAWTGDQNFAVLYSNGQITRASLDDYFDGIFCDYELNYLENCKRIRALGDPIYALTENRLDNIVTTEENKQRVGAELTIFVTFHLTFLLKLMKALFSFLFGGDATQDLNEKMGIEQSAKLSLYTTKTSNLNEFIDKCMRNHKYQLAVSLAEPAKSWFDIDIIYKRQWEDLKQAQSIDEEDLNVLRSVHDKLWVIEECLRLDITTSIQLHEKLLKLAAIVSKSLDNEKLYCRILNASQVLAIIRTNASCDKDACELYLRFRRSTILVFAFSMAEETNFDLLKLLFKKHQNELHDYLLLILNAIPESTEPSKYAEFLPYLDTIETPDGGFVLKKSAQLKTPADIKKIPPKYAGFVEFLLGNDDVDDNALFEKWCQQRVEAIDAVSGLNDDCVQFLCFAIEHGCGSLNELRSQYKLYNNFIMFSGSTTITFKQFLNSDASTVQTMLTAHMTKKKLLEHLEDAVQLIIFADKGRGKAVEQIMSLVCAHSIQGFEVLHALKQIHPEILNTENLVQCFIYSKVFGPKLTEAMRDLGLPSGLVNAVEFYAEIKSDQTPTFSDIHSAINDSNKATQLIQLYIHGNCVSSVHNRNDEWWRDLLTKSRQLRHSAFEKVVSDEQILRFICVEMLNAVCSNINSEVPAARRAPFHLIVDLTSTSAAANISLLHQSVFEELIVEKSKDFVDSSIPDLNDANFKRASLALEALRTGVRLPRLIAAQKRAIDVIQLSLELGSKRVPATFAYCSKDILLSEIVNTKNNYKNVKMCAELAKLLELNTPSARALTECAICALQRDDINTLKQYVQQISKNVKDFAIVYELAKTILEHNLDDEELNDDSLACLIHNCPENELTMALGILSDHRTRHALQKSTTAIESSDTSYPDPMYTHINSLHQFDFESTNSPLKIPLHTHQSDIFMYLENQTEAVNRINSNPHLKEIAETIKVLQREGLHPFILENLNSEHYHQIALRSGLHVGSEEENSDANEEN